MPTNENRKIFLATLAFLMFQILLETYLFHVNYSAYLIEFFYNKNLFFFLADFCAVTVSLLLFFAFVFFALGSSKIYKAVCFVIFSISVISEFGYQKALGRFSDKLDINLALITTFEQKIFSAVMYLNPNAIFSCLAFLILLICFRRVENKFSNKNLVLVALCAGLLYTLSSQYGDMVFNTKFPVPAVNSFLRTNVDYVVSTEFTDHSKPWGSTDATARLPVRSPVLEVSYQPNNNIVMVVDESVTATHLSLNGYDRPTTPFLDDLAARKILYNWNTAAAASTASFYSYRMIITGVPPDQVTADQGEAVRSGPTFFQYAKAMKYTTYYFDGQMKDYWGGSDDDKNYIDHWIGSEQIGDTANIENWEIDNIIARRVNEILKSSTGNFIFIFKHGSHIPYHKNFPAGEAVWTPSYMTVNMLGIPSEEESSEVVNAYDNSLRYNINSFFKNLIDDYTNIPNNTKIIYTGDHGQTLFAEGRASHGGSSKIEATVPLFVIGRLDREPDTQFAASHCNIYPTLLDLMKYPKDLRHRNDVPSLLEAAAADSKPRFYNPDSGEKVPFD